MKRILVAVLVVTVAVVIAIGDPGPRAADPVYDRWTFVGTHPEVDRSGRAIIVVECAKGDRRTDLPVPHGLDSTRGAEVGDPCPVVAAP